MPDSQYPNMRKPAWVWASWSGPELLGDPLLQSLTVLSGTGNCTLAAALTFNQCWAPLKKTCHFSVCLSPSSTSFSFPLASPCLRFGVCLCPQLPLCLSGRDYLYIKYIFNGPVESTCFSPSVSFSFTFHSSHPLTES